MSTPSIQTLITQAQQVLNLKSSNEIRATLAAVLANANVGTPLNPNLTTQQLWDEFYEIVRQPSDDIMSIITDQMMRMVFSPPAPGGAGADKQVIFNDMGVLAGDAGLMYNKATDALTITGAATVGTTLGVTGVSTFAAGTALLPALTTTGDTNTGIYYPAADTFAVTTAGVERYRVDSTGLGIGGSPSYKLSAIGTTNNQVVLHVGNTAGSSDGDTTNVVRFAAGSGANALWANARYDGFAHAWRCNSTTTQAMTLDASGNLSLANGNLVMGTSGKGIDFSAVTGGTGTATANVLNDYEEGTWTPVAVSLTVVGSVTYPVATYTKIGRVVYINLKVAASTSSTSTENVTYFTGLPFTPTVNSTVTAVNEQNVGSLGVGLFAANARLYSPTWTAIANATLSGFYYV